MPADERPVLFGLETTSCMSCPCSLPVVVPLPLGASAVGSFAPRLTCPTPANFARALVATHGEHGWIMRVRNWMKKDAE